MGLHGQFFLETRRRLVVAVATIGTGVVIGGAAQGRRDD